MGGVDCAGEILDCEVLCAGIRVFGEGTEPGEVVFERRKGDLH